MSFWSWLIGASEEPSPIDCMMTKLNVYRVGLTSVYSMHGAQARIRKVKNDPNVVIMSEFTTDYPHTGARKSFMLRLCRIADECNMNIRLHPSAVSSDIIQLPTGACTITVWFSEFGFRSTTRHGLERKPNKKIPKSVKEPEEEFDIEIELDEKGEAKTRIKPKK